MQLLVVPRSIPSTLAISSSQLSPPTMGDIKDIAKTVPNFMGVTRQDALSLTKHNNFQTKCAFFGVAEA
jgi:hypothetical protein